MALEQTAEPLMIGARLQTIADIVLAKQASKHYDAVWDCCCDHGYLGMYLLNEKLAAKLYFVDQVPHITQQLSPKLAAYTDDQYAVYCADVTQLELNPNQRHLLILAGISAKNIIGIMEGIQKRYPQGQFDFILCPTNAIYNLRSYLHQRKNDISLVSECFITEKKRHYEIMHISTQSLGQPVSLTGTQWQQENTIHREYLHKLIQHFERESQDVERSRAKALLQNYKTIYADLYDHQ
jgi:tRNA (adenine22-N1)-methyltransferase